MAIKTDTALLYGIVASESEAAEAFAVSASELLLLFFIYTSFVGRVCGCNSSHAALWIVVKMNVIANMTQDLLGAEAGDRQQSTSTWQGIVRKVSMLLPFVWPRGSLPLQICVIACVALLVAGRVANLYIPLYYKKIGNNTVYPITHFSSYCGI